MLSINLASYYIPTPLAVSTPSELLQLGLEMKKMAGYAPENNSKLYRKSKCWTKGGANE